MPDEFLEQRVGAVRRFNRFYTRRIGVLQDNFLNSSYSLAEGRVRFELAHREQPTATTLAAALGLDHGYLSRIFRSFSERGLITKVPAPNDRRQSLFALTVKGRLAFGRIDQRSQDQIAEMLEKLPPTDQERMIAAMHTIESALREMAEPVPAYILRPPRAGDM